MRYLGTQNNDKSIITKDYVAEEFQPKLTAGENITIDANNVISATGGGSSEAGMLYKKLLASAKTNNQVGSWGLYYFNNIIYNPHEAYKSLDDGLTWVNATAKYSSICCDYSVTSNKIIGVFYNGALLSFSYSSDASTWTNVNLTTPSGTINNISISTINDTTYVIVCNYTFSSVNYYVCYYTTDSGTTWITATPITESTFSTYNFLKVIKFANTYYLFARDSWSGKVYKSTDLSTWEYANVVGKLDVALGGTCLFKSRLRGSEYSFSTSTDGQTWPAISSSVLATGSKAFVCSSDTTMMIVQETGIIPTRVVISHDGVNWETKTSFSPSPSDQSDYTATNYSFDYINGAFVFMKAIPVSPAPGKFVTYTSYDNGTSWFELSISDGVGTHSSNAYVSHCATPTAILSVIYYTEGSGYKNGIYRFSFTGNGVILQNNQNITSNVANTITSYLPTASDSTKGIAQVDGQTIESNNGVLSATGYSSMRFEEVNPSNNVQTTSNATNEEWVWFKAEGFETEH